MPVSYAKLFKLMEQKGIKKVDLRTTYNFNPKTVDSLVKHRSVTVDTIMKLCEIFNCQPGDLMEYYPEGGTPPSLMPPDPEKEKKRDEMYEESIRRLTEDQLKKEFLDKILDFVNDLK